MTSRPSRPPDDQCPLATARLVLTPVTTADAARLQRLLNEPEVGRYLLDGERVGRAFVHQAIEDSDEAFARHGVGLYLAEAEGALVGLVGFRHFFDPPELQLLYALHPSHQGHGYATEMARAVVEHAFANGLAEVRASTAAPNLRSVRVLERLGMEPMGKSAGPRHEQLHFVMRRDRRRGKGEPSS